MRSGRRPAQGGVVVSWPMMQQAPPPASRVGPAPAPPPERLNTWTVLDLLATTRRWRVNEPFIAGQTDGLSRALVSCLNARQPVPRWLRETIVGFLLEALWERPRLADGSSNGASWEEERDDLVWRWREPARGSIG
ncbi:MAG TPA: hypothetical protein VGW38_13220 [Chloroflexota bacterium]|nr:hypothetical protein [Chloroflexota bacterium]